MCRTILLAALLASSPLWGSAARAQDGWTGLPGCIEQPDFEAAFEAALAIPLAEYAPSGTHIAVAFEAAEGFTVTVAVEARGVRRSRALNTRGACRDLDEGLLVVVALLVEDVGTEVARLPPIVLPPPPASAPYQSARLGRAGGERAQPSLRGALALGGSLRVDALPGLTIGPSLGGELRAADIVTIGLVASYLPPVVSLRADGIGVEASAVGVGLHGCVLGPLASFFELGGCVQVTGWAITGSGRGLSEPLSGIGFGLDGALSIRGGLSLLDPLWLRAEVGLGLSMVRARLYYEMGGNPQTFHLASIAFPTASIFLEIRLGDS